MGATESIPTQLSHERLYQLTHDTRAIMNLILQYMLKEVTVKDFLALSNPAECKKYVLFMANTLHKYFYELQIQPTRDRSGIIAFRSVRDLVAPSTETDREKQSLCLVLAYYYTRIFQIYGALALTLIDDISSMREARIMTEPRHGLVAPGQRQVMYGGTLTDAELGRFAFLKGFLLDERSTHGYRTKFREQQGLYGEVFFSVKPDVAPASADPMAVSATTSTAKGTFTFSYEGAQRYSTVSVRVERVSLASTGSVGAVGSLYSNASRPTSGLRLVFESIQYAKKGETTLRTEEIPATYMTKALPPLYPITTSNGQTVYAFRDTTRSLNEVLQDSLYKIMRFTKTLVEEGRRLNTSGAPSAPSDATAAPKIPQAEVLTALSTSEEGVVEELRLGKILHHLTQSKPYGHCIARALQLLDTAPFPNQPAISHICKAKFLEVSGPSEKGTARYSRSGLPEPGAVLTSSPGLFALSQLFYDTIAVGTPKLAINQQPGPLGKSTLQQYVEFMRRMATYFGDNRMASGDVRSNDALREAGLGGLRNRRDSELCRGHVGDISISPETARQVYRVVQDLFQEQLAHASVCGRIFRMLFDIQREPTTGRVKIALHENVLRRGVPEINRINFLARDQLMKYYSNCEAKYLGGLKLVVDSKRREQVAKAPAPAPSPSAPSASLVPSAPSASLVPAAPAPAPPTPRQKQFQDINRFIASVKPIAATKEAVATARARGQIPSATVPISRPIPATKEAIAAARARGDLPSAATKAVRFV